MSNFRPFGLDHWVVLAFVVLTGFALVASKGAIRGLKDDRWIRYIWAAGLIGIESATWAFFFDRGIVILPMQLCDWALFLTVWALLGGNRFVIELAFFWGLAASSQAILTPDLKEGFPSFQWFSFLFTHSGVILAVLYLLARGKVCVTRISPWRVWLLTNFYAAVSGLVNWSLGTNFGYLARKPDQPSLLDYFGPWPYYIFWGEWIALVLFFLCYGLARAVGRGRDSKGTGAV